MSQWFREFNQIWPFPDNYVCVDVETSGLRPEENMLCTFGWTKVVNRQRTETGLIVLNWFEHPEVNSTQLEQELLRCAQAMESKGDRFFHTAAYLRDRGTPPVQGLQRIRNLIMQAERDGMPLVAHNGYGFDAEFLQAHFHDFLGESIMIGDNAMFDTGMAEKASQLQERDNPLPLEGETLRAWAWRIASLRRKGVMWSARGHCEQRYQISRKFGLNMDNYHASDFDSIFLHYLFEEQRRCAFEQ